MTSAWLFVWFACVRAWACRMHQNSQRKTFSCSLGGKVTSTTCNNYQLKYTLSSFCFGERFGICRHSEVTRPILSRTHIAQHTRIEYETHSMANHRRVLIHISSIRRVGIARKTVRKQTKEYVEHFVTPMPLTQTHTHTISWFTRAFLLAANRFAMPHRWCQRDDLRRTMVWSIRRLLFFCAVVCGDDDVKLLQLPKKRHLISF